MHKPNNIPVCALQSGEGAGTGTAAASGMFNRLRAMIKQNRKSSDSGEVTSPQLVRLVDWHY
jgi:hypothetical protein